ncbi:MAG: hypothetical protein ACM33U_01225 [Solirubrobacterales bacterium]
MSEENVEVVRGIYDATARRDNVTPFEVYAAYVVVYISNMRRAALGMKPVYHGPEGVPITEVRRLLETRQRELKAELRKSRLP